MSRQEQATGEETARWHDFGAWLAQTRVDLGYTQAHVACQADISTQSLVSLEHGGFRRYADGPWILPNPRDDTLVSLARLYGVKAEEMFKRVGRYAARPQTKTSLRRRGRASSRQPARGDRIAELEARLEDESRRTGERNEELEERQRGIEEALRKAGIPLDGRVTSGAGALPAAARYRVVARRPGRRRRLSWTARADPRGDQMPTTARSADDQLLTEEDLAESLRVSLRTVRRCCHDRTGPRVVRVMWAPRYWRSDVVAWVEGQGAE